MIMTMRVTRVVPQRSSIWGNKVMRSIKPPAGRSVLVVGDEPLIAGNLWAGISKKSREARLVKFADTISNLRAFAVSPPAGWSNDRRLGYLNSCRNLVDAGRGSNTKMERIFDDTAKAVEQAIRTEDLGDIDSSTSARREFEAAIGQSVHLVYIPNTRCRPLGEGDIDLLCQTIARTFPAAVVQTAEGIYESRRRSMRQVVELITEGYTNRADCWSSQSLSRRERRSEI